MRPTESHIRLIKPVMAGQSKDMSFRWIKQGEGGTFTFPLEEARGGNVPRDALCHIGTYWCASCVGIYLEVDENRCFCAHINSLSFDKIPPNTVTERDGQEIKAKVLAQLLIESANSHWNPRHKNFARDIVIVCPHLDLAGASENGETLTQTGRYTIMAIREFLNLQATSLSQEADSHTAEAQKLEAHHKPKEVIQAEKNKSTSLSDQASVLLQRANFVPDTTAQGFVINHQTGAQFMFRDNVSEAQARHRGLRRFGLPRDMSPFVPVEEPGLDSWKWVFSSDADERNFADRFKPASQAFVRGGPSS